MATTTIATANEVKQWDSKFFMEYVRDNLFKPYMGTSENSAIMLNEKLGKMPGDAVTVSLIGRLTGANVGSGTLEGNEEALDNYGHQINLSVIRNAVAINNFEEQSTVIDIRNAAKTALKNWCTDLMRDEILEALHFQVANYGTATAANHDTWAAANSDRVIYVGQATTGNHTTDLATLAAGTDTLDAATVSLARRKARAADPHIKPIRVNGSEEWFVMFCDPYAFRDLKNDTTIQQAQREALARGQSNPLFKAGDIIYDGVIIREIPEIANKIDDGAGTWGAGATADSLATAGTTSARVGVSFLLGAQAVGVAWGKRTKSTTETREYGFLNGVGIEEFRGTEKLIFNGADHGVVTVYSAAATD